jgi:hypothetical protein
MTKATQMRGFSHLNIFLPDRLASKYFEICLLKSDCLIKPISALISVTAAIRYP